MVHPLLITIASFIIPGVGQVISGDTKKGAIFFVIFIILAFATRALHAGLIGYFITLLYRLYASYDVYQTFQ